MPANMRRPTEYPRGRLPVAVDLTLDGTTVLAAALPPTGLSGDGPPCVYRRFAVAPGRHRLVAERGFRLRTRG